MIKKGSWVFDGTDQIARVKVVNDDGTLDLRFYGRSGISLSLEPSCGQERWFEIEKPQFPLNKFSYLDRLVIHVSEGSENEVCRG